MPYLNVFIAQFLCYNAHLSHINLITQLCTWEYIYLPLYLCFSFCLLFSLTTPWIQIRIRIRNDSLSFAQKNTKTFHCVHNVMLFVVYTVACPPPPLPFPSPWPSNALANPTFVCQCVRELSRPTCRLTRCFVRAAAGDYLLLTRRAENVWSGEWRVENSASISNRIGWNIQIRCDLQHSSHCKWTKPRRVKAFPRTLPWASINSDSPWNTLVFPFLPALACSAVLVVARPWPSCCPCQKFRMNLKVVVHGEAGRLSLNRFAGRRCRRVGDFIGAMTVA